MTKATLTITDEGDQISVTCELDGPFDAKDNAHQHANIVLNYLGDLSNSAPATEQCNSEAMRGDLERMKDAICLMTFHRCEESQLWTALDAALVEIEKALAIPDEALAPVDMAHKIVGANGLALGSH